MITPDDKLQRYATDNQWDDYVAYCEHGSYSAAAEARGKNRKVLARAVEQLKRKAAQQGYMPDMKPAIDLRIPEGMTSRGPSILLDKDGNVEQVWNKMKPQGRDPADTVQLPDPKRIRRIATLTDNQGNVSQQWVTEEPDATRQAEMWQAFADGIKDELPRYEPIPQNGTTDFAKFLACYPVGDHHLGMLAWKHETKGDSYDIEVSEKLLGDASSFLIDAAPPCQHALIPFLGDFLHYDSFEAVTPASRNLLDADGRYPKMVRAGVRAMRTMIDKALMRHANVTVIVEIGNHDLSSSIFLMECLRIAYEFEPRVMIDCSPSHYHYFEFGKTLIGTHHGHGTKMDNLPLIMANDRPEAWGRTIHRYIWTGHIHTRKQKDYTAQDYAGCTVESFRILAPLDAWAAQKGYRPTRDMKCIIIDGEYGEVSRSTVKPEMFK